MTRRKHAPELKKCSGPGTRRRSIDERTRFKGSGTLALTSTHRVNPASCQVFGEPLATMPELYRQRMTNGTLPADGTPILVREYGL